MSSANLSYLVDRRAKVRAAIDEVLTAGQSMSLDDGISYTRATVSRLYSMEKDINNQLARLSGSRPLFQSVKMVTPYSS